MKAIKRFAAALLALAMTLTLSVAFVMPAAAADFWDGTAVATSYAAGTGSETDPYQIATAAQLAFLATEGEISSSAGKFYKLTNDIDLVEFPWTIIGTTKELSFKGIFDGDGHIVSGLNCVNEEVSSNTYAGLFGYISGATIKNLTVTGKKIVAKYAGPIVAYAIQGSQVINCKSKVECIDGVTIGGIVGRHQDEGSQILYCTSESNINQTVISAASNPDHFIGGIVGAGGNLTVSYCANKGNIVCGHDGEATARHYHAGGIVGVHGASSNPVHIKYCYNLGNISGYDTLSSKGTSNNVSAGGIVGRGGHVANGSIVGCYSIGNINWTAEKGGTGISERVGGVVGLASNIFTITDCYTNMDIIVGKNEAMVNVDTLKTLTLAEMQGADALKNMNLGSTVGAVLDSCVESGVANANYRSAVLEAFLDYTGGKTLVEYVNEKVREKLNLTDGADIWVTAEGKTPELGSIDALMMSAEIPELTSAAVDEVLEGLYEQYQADPKYTTTGDEEETEDPGEDTEPTKQTFIQGQTTTPSNNTTKAPTDDKTDEKSCGGFAAAAAVITVVVAALSCAIVIKKN